MAIIVGCNDKQDPVEGTWKVESRFYSATCEIQKEDGYFDGIVLSYDDGTTSYRFSENDPRYFFKNLKKKGEYYVDGVSGATKSGYSSDQLKIELIATDTLKMISMVSNKPIEELWIRN